ncbi:hypothetical protein ACOSQ4_027040 [Xanthoceras sorbifolium]
MLHIQSRNVLGKEFLCIQDAEEYYHKYSYLKGFNVRKDDLRCDKNGLITVSTMRVNNNCQKMVWVVKEFVTEHSHNLTSGKHMRFLRSHRNAKEYDMSILNSLKLVGIKTCRTMLTDFDADAIIDYMTAESEMDTKVFYKYDVNEDGMSGNLFWADSMSRNDYRNFGDVMSFDSTYKTNAYLRLLVIFVGVNHHNNTTVFGFRQLVDETVEMSSCILKTFLLAMLYPILIVSDGDKAMRKAIKSEILDPSIEFALGIFNGMFGPISEKWFYSIVYALYGSLHDSIRAETFMRDTFFGGMRSTQRSESTDAYLNRFLHCRLKLYEFIRQVDRSMARLRINEMKDDFDSLNEHPILVTHLVQLEKHIFEVYTRKIFELLLQTADIPCSHSFSVMKALNMHHILEILLMRRWTMNAQDVSELEISFNGTPQDLIQVASFEMWNPWSSQELAKSIHCITEVRTSDSEIYQPTN